MTDREAFNEFAKGLAFTIGVVGVVVLLFAIFLPSEEIPKSNFEVVDTYSYENRTCSVIRYTNPSTTWVYLLDCKEVKK